MHSHLGGRVMEGGWELMRDKSALQKKAGMDRWQGKGSMTEKKGGSHEGAVRVR